MLVNGKFQDFHEEDLLEVGDRFAVGTATTVISRVRNTIKESPRFAERANLPKPLVSDIGKQHDLLGR